MKTFYLVWALVTTLAVVWETNELLHLKGEVLETHELMNDAIELAVSYRDDYMWCRYQLDGAGASL